MQKSIIAIFILSVCALAASGNALSRSDVRHKQKSTQNTPPQNTHEGSYKAYLVMDADTGKVLEGENTHLRWPPASLTKLMLAYIVMDKIEKGELHLGDHITVSAKASKMGGSQVYLKQGEIFTLEDLMKATMVESANDAAYAIGEFIAGGKEAFVKLMNAKARQLNMRDTEYHSVHGLPPSRGQREDLTSCRDLAILARKLLNYPRILTWTSIKTDYFRNGTFMLTNSNTLVRKIPEVDGLKTGYYRKAGFNIVATAKKGDSRLIVVVLGSPNPNARDSIVKEKFNKFFSKQALSSQGG